VSQTEQEAPLQMRAGRALAQLMLLSARREPNPNTMITQNVIKALCAEGHHKLAAFTRAAAPVPESEGEDEKKKRGRKREVNEVRTDEDNAAMKEARLSVRGAQFTLQALAEVFGAQLFQALARLWDLLATPFKTALMSAQISAEADQQLIDALHVLSTVIAHVDRALWREITELMKSMIQLIPQLSTDTRELNAVALSQICRVLGVEAMKIVLEQLVPLLQHQTQVEARLGAAVALHRKYLHWTLDVEYSALC
jgi:TATA-binding protein-associated factor